MALPQSQEELDKLIDDRLKRAKQQWEQENGIAGAQRERDEAKQNADKAQRDAHARIVARDARGVLSGMNVTDPKRQQRIIQFADLAAVQADDQGEPKTKDIEGAFKKLYDDAPELFPQESQVKEKGADSGGGEDSGGSGGGSDTSPLTREKIEGMSHDEINEPKMWERVQKFLSGQK